MNQLKDAIRREKKEIERYEKLHGPVPVVKVNNSSSHFPFSHVPVLPFLQSFNNLASGFLG